MTQSNQNFVPAMSEIAREAGASLMDYFRQHVKVEYTVKEGRRAIAIADVPK